VAKPMSNLAFGVMSLLFRVRDLLWPPRDIIEEAGIAPGARVLDFGCGPGSYSIAAAGIVGESGKVYALDVHPSAIRAVQKRAAALGLKNVETIRGPVPPTLEADSIDVVLLYDTFHMLDDPQGVLRDLHRVLKPQGTLSFTDHHMKEAQVRQQVTAGGLFELSEKRRYSYCFRKAEKQP